MPNPRLFSAALAALLLASGPLFGQGQVFVVDDDPGPGVDFNDLQTAIDQAQDGDLVIVRPGGYGPAHIAAKAVSIVGDGSPRPIVWATLRVTGVAAGKTVVLRGLDVHIPFLSQVEGLEIDGCGGVVAVEEVDVVSQWPLFGLEVPAVRVRNSTAVSLTRVTGEGARGITGFLGQPGSEVPGGPGLFVDGSTVAAYECEFRGGEGPTGGVFNATSAPGGPGVRLANQSFLFAHGCAFLGGKGGDGNMLLGSGCTQAQPGGDGVVGDGSVELLDTQAVGGAGGAPFTGCSPPGPDGVPVNVTGAVQVIAEPARGYRVGSPAYVGTNVDHVFSGQPGDFAVLLASIQGGLLDGGGIPGFLLPSPPLFVVPIGTIPATGVLTVPIVVPPALPPGVEHVPFFEQFGVAGSTGTGFLSSPSVVHVVQ